jgi:hypothetical protein
VVLNNHGFTKSFTEHCLIIGLVNVRADLTYQKGLDKKFSRLTRYDHYWPSLDGIGEQSVTNGEIWADGTATDDLVFGYQERWSEYKFKQNIISGLFRSDATASLDAWHLSEDFTTLPVLGDTFIQSNTPMDRAIAVPAEPHFIFDGYFKVNSARPMPTYSIPGLDRF